MKHLKLIFSTLLLLVSAVTNTTQAQNVTLKATNGSMIAAVKDYGTTDAFFNLGGFATWQHEQLCMVLTVSDGTNLTPNGQLDNPANNLFSDGTHILIAKGQGNNANVCYATLSLPKGYRFTGYSITFTKPGGVPDNSFNASNQQSTFGETNSTFDTYTTQATITTNGTAQKITRDEEDMGNVLYFKLQNPSSSRASITLESAEFFFTAEENYSPLTPAGEITSPVSAVDVPFLTSKVDYGPITNRSYNGVSRVSYSSANVTDLEANFVLFEAESTKPGTGIDGISGQVVDYHAGSISSEGGYFKFDSPNQEQVYYIESPTYVTLSNGTNNPVGYRIVGTEFEYELPNAEIKYYITYTSGGTTYYLGTNGQFSTTKTEWNRDNNGRIYSGNTYLGFEVSGIPLFRTFTFRTYTSVPDNALTINNNRITGSWALYTIYLKYDNGSAIVATGNNGNLASWTGETDSDNEFTLYVYDKTGANKTGYAVNNSNPSGKVSLTGLNNDAVKFGIQGTGLLRATLTLQALDPYLDRMDVVCQDEQKPAIRMEQYFTASDFSVNGGEFHFSLPHDCHGDDVSITFENLKSKYFDETYDGGSSNHFSRISFVRSAHYDAFGTSSNNVYTNTSEAASDRPLERQEVSIVGSAPFKFNNADEVGDQNGTGGTLTEYPFSLENYAAAPNEGTFGVMEFTATSTIQSKTGYVFTTDETRYNIAPTTATQHRAYAFYKMIVSIETTEYTPEIAFTKIYDSTFYVDKDNQQKYDAFYGVTVNAWQDEAKTIPGYSSTDAIFQGIERILNTTHVDDAGTSIPQGTTAKQILYLDFSHLKGIYQITTDTHQSMEDYSATNAANSLIFLPVGASAPNNNVAYKMESGGFRAANNIIITDKQPFFSPYDIQVDQENYAEYRRQITNPKNGMETLCTLILPFSINVTESDGKLIHTNSDNSCSFSLHQINEDNALDLVQGSEGTVTNFEYGHEGYFGNPREEDYIERAGQTITAKANVPYVVEVTRNGDALEAQEILFIAHVNGTKISATPWGTSETVRGILTGETASATVDGNPINFTNKGTYRGKEILNAKNASEKVFYFAKNYFLNSTTLVDGLSLKILPFRAFYDYTGNASGVQGFRFVFGENETDPSSVAALKRNADLAVTAGKGTITFMAKADNDVAVISTNGTMVNKVSLKAGETHTIQLPAGIYLINGMKIVVR